MQATATASQRKRDKVAETLQRWYPQHVVPTGGFTAVAAAVGASKPLVSVVARDLGYTSAAPHKRTRKPEGCKHCGREVEPGKRMCYECRQVTLACDTCGRLFKRRRDRVMERERDPRYQGGTYCSPRCYFKRTKS
jgi:hypothetical protein